jgi:hypothetical protein
MFCGWGWVGTAGCSLRGLSSLSLSLSLSWGREREREKEREIIERESQAEEKVEAPTRVVPDR